MLLLLLDLELQGSCGHWCKPKRFRIFIGSICDLFGETLSFRNSKLPTSAPLSGTPVLGGTAYPKCKNTKFLQA